MAIRETKHPQFRALSFGDGVAPVRDTKHVQFRALTMVGANARVTKLARFVVIHLEYEVGQPISDTGIPSSVVIETAGAVLGPDVGFWDGRSGLGHFWPGNALLGLEGQTLDATAETGLDASYALDSGGLVEITVPPNEIIGSLTIYAGPTLESDGYVSFLIDGSAVAGIASTATVNTGGSLESEISGVLSIDPPIAPFGTGGEVHGLTGINGPHFVVFHHGSALHAEGCGRFYGPRVGTIKVDCDANAAARASYTLVDVGVQQIPEIGTEVVIWVYDERPGVPDYTKVFGGRIEQVTIIEEPGLLDGDFTRLRNYNISAAGYGQSLAHRVLTVKFPSRDYGTFNSIMTVLDRDYLRQEGITWTGGTDPGISLGDLEFSATTLNEIMDRLTEAVGYSWQVDFDGNLRTGVTFNFDTTAPRSINVTDTNFHGLEITRSRGLYRNRQVVRGTQTRTTQQVTVSYTLPFGEAGPPYGEFWGYFGLRWNAATASFDPEPLGNVFLNDERYRNRVERVVSVKRNGTPEVFVFLGDSYVWPADAPADWGWQFFGKSLNMAWNMTGRPGQQPANGDVIEITFDLLGDLPQPIVVEDATEIAARRAIEGNSGIYEDVVELPDVDDEETLRRYAEGLLAKFKRMGLEVSYKTDQLGIQVGMQQTVNIPRLGINNELCVVESTSLEDLSDKALRMSVKVSSIIQQRGAMEAFKRLIYSIRAAANKGTKTQITFTLAQDIPGLTNPGLQVQNTITNTYVLRQNMTLKECAMFFQVPPEGGAIEIDIKANGVSIFATRPRYTTGQQVFTGFTSAPLTLAKGTQVTIDVLATGTVNPGKNGTVTLLGWV